MSTISLEMTSSSAIYTAGTFTPAETLQVTLLSTYIKTSQDQVMPSLRLVFAPEVKGSFKKITVVSSEGYCLRNVSYHQGVTIFFDTKCLELANLQGTSIIKDVSIRLYNFHLRRPSGWHCTWRSSWGGRFCCCDTIGHPTVTYQGISIQRSKILQTSNNVN